MPASVSDGPCVDVLDTKSDETVNFNAYLVKNFSLSDSSASKLADTLPWASDLSLNLSEPLRTPSERHYNNFSSIDNESLECIQMDDVFNFYDDLAKKVLSTPDPAVFRSLTSRTDPGKRFCETFQVGNVKCFDHADYGFPNGSFLHSSFAAQNELMELSKISSVSDICAAINESSHSKIYDEHNTTNLSMDRQICTPKVSTEMKKNQLRNIMNERARPKRKLTRNFTSKSIPNFMLLDCVSPATPRHKTRKSSADISDIFSSMCSRRGMSYRSSRSRLFSKFSDDSSRRDSEKADAFASYLGYADFSRALMSTINDCAFESPKQKSSSRKRKLQSVHEFNIEGHFGEEPVPLSVAVFKGDSMKTPKRTKFSDSIVQLSPSTLFKTLLPVTASIDIAEDLVPNAGLVHLIVDVRFIPRPMFIPKEYSDADDRFSIAKVTSSIGCRLFEKAFVPERVQVILRNELAKKMGNGNSRTLTTHKFLPGVGKRENVNCTLQRRRYGPREVHKNIWRLERKTVVGKSLKDSEMVE